jgi:hypothetical protein
MKKLTEIESMCGRILAVLEHDNLRSDNLTALAHMVNRMRDDLKHHLAGFHSAGGNTAEVHVVDDALERIDNDLLWLREYAGVKPVVEVIHRLRMATLHTRRVITVLQDVPAPMESHSNPSIPSRRSAPGQHPVRA